MTWASDRRFRSRAMPDRLRSAAEAAQRSATVKESGRRRWRRARPRARLRTSDDCMQCYCACDSFDGGFSRRSVTECIVWVRTKLVAPPDIMNLALIQDYHSDRRAYGSNEQGTDGRMYTGPDTTVDTVRFTREITQCMSCAGAPCGRAHNEPYEATQIDHNTV
jgi:hypothetical protein